MMNCREIPVGFYRKENYSLLPFRFRRMTGNEVLLTGLSGGVSVSFK